MEEGVLVPCKIIKLQIAKSEHVLQLLNLFLISGLVDFVNVFYHSLDIPTAVLCHSLLNGNKVSPLNIIWVINFLIWYLKTHVVINCLHGSTGGVICPESTRGDWLGPGSQSSTIRSSTQDPRLESTILDQNRMIGRWYTYGILGIVAVVCIKRKIHILSKVDEIGNGIF